MIYSTLVIKKIAKVDYTGTWYLTGVTKNLSMSNIPVYGIFDLGNKKLVRSKIPVYGVFDLGNEKISRSRQYRYVVYSIMVSTGI